MAQTAYLTTTNGISVVDIPTATQTTVYQSGSNYNGGYIASHPDNSKLYACRPGSNLVDVIDLVVTPGHLITSLAVTSPQFVIVSGDGTKVYISQNGSPTLWVYDANTFAFITNITLPSPSANSGGLSFSPDHTLIYASSPTGAAGGGHVYAITVATDTVTGSILLPPFTGSETNTAVSADGTTGYVGDTTSNFTPNTVILILDLTTDTFVTHFSVSQPPSGQSLCLNFPNTTLYTGTSGNIVSVASPPTAETSTISGVGIDAGMALTGDGTTLVAADRSSAFCNFIDVGTNTITHTPAIVADATGVCMVPQGFFPPPPPSLTVPKLFIPRKGLGDYDEQDYMIDWLAIERWANSWAPPLFIPNKPFGRPPTTDELTENWVEIEVWVQGTARAVMTAGGIGSAWTALLIPRKDSLQPIDLTTDWLAIENWANGL